MKRFLVLLLLFFLIFTSPSWAQTTGQCSSSDPAACSNFEPSPSPSSSPSPSPSSSPSPTPSTTNEHSDFWSLVSGIIKNPGGAVNAFINGIVDAIASLFPSTPQELKIGSLINSIGDSMPVVGRGIIRELFGTIATCFGLVAIIKIYKLIPFKAT